MVGITEVEFDFGSEPEQVPYLKKTDVLEPLTAELISCKQKAFVSKKGKGYYAFALVVRLDEYTEKEISPLFRSELLWKKVKPKHVIIATEQKGEFLQWRISPA